MRKIIVDYRKLNNEVLDLLVETYPDGYDDDDIISYRNSHGEIVECVRVNGEDTIYLVKVSKRLILAMEDHGSEEEDEENGNDDLQGAEDTLTDDFLDHEDEDSFDDDDAY